MAKEKIYLLVEVDSSYEFRIPMNRSIYADVYSILNSRRSYLSNPEHYFHHPLLNIFSFNYRYKDKQGAPCLTSIRKDSGIGLSVNRFDGNWHDYSIAFELGADVLGGAEFELVTFVECEARYITYMYTKSLFEYNNIRTSFYRDKKSLKEYIKSKHGVEYEKKFFNYQKCFSKLDKQFYNTLNETLAPLAGIDSVFPFAWIVASRNPELEWIDSFYADRSMLLDSYNLYFPNTGPSPKINDEDELKKLSGDPEFVSES